MKSARLDACKGRIDDVRVEDVPVPGPGQPRVRMPIARVSPPRLPSWILFLAPRKLHGILRKVRKLAIEGVSRAEVAASFLLDQVAAASAALALAPAPTERVMLQIGSP